MSVRNLFRDTYRREHLECLVEFERDNIEKFLDFLFWRDHNGLEKELILNDQQLLNIFDTDSVGHTLCCTLKLESNIPLYFKKEFSDEIYWGVRLAAIVYNADSVCSDGTADVPLAGFNGTILRSDCHLENCSSLRFLLAMQGKRLYIAVRGTVDITNWLSNFAVVGQDFSAGGSVGQVHTGFLQLANQISVQNLVKRLQSDENLEQIVVCGHSLGGAIATLLTAKILAASKYRLTNRQLLCVTIGAPPVGETNFCSFMQSDLDENITKTNYIHLVHAGDIVPRVMNLVSAIGRYMTLGAIASGDNEMKYRYLDTTSQVFEQSLTSWGSTPPKQGYTNLKIKAFDQPSRVLRRVGKVDYMNTERLSTPNLLTHITLQRNIPLYEQCGCVLLFPQGIRASPEAHHGDPRINDHVSLKILSETCMVQYHGADVYINTMMTYLERNEENESIEYDRTRDITLLTDIMIEISQLQPPWEVLAKETDVVRSTRELRLLALPSPTLANTTNLDDCVSCIIDAYLELHVPGFQRKHRNSFLTAVRSIYFLDCQNRLPRNFPSKEILKRIFRCIQLLSWEDASSLKLCIESLVKLSPCEKLGQDMYKFLQHLTDPKKKRLPWKREDDFSYHLYGDKPHVEGKPAIKRGYMYKEGSFVHNWKKRFFVLEEGFLTYYERDFKDKVGKNKKGVSLRLAGYGVNEITTPRYPGGLLRREREGFDCGIDLVPKNSALRTLKLDFGGSTEMKALYEDNNHERASWMSALTEHITYANTLAATDQDQPRAVHDEENHQQAEQSQVDDGTVNTLHDTLNTGMATEQGQYSVVHDESKVSGSSNRR